MGVPVGLPATKGMAEIGALAMRSRCARTPELLLKSRRVVPGRLADAGFAFEYARWTEAAEELAERVRRRGRASRTRVSGGFPWARD
ncbi:DUF1731 domain-containing protein [Actinomadura sp. 7K507]|uniref:DUF1731 domain-containing protein n=1 Tax=Actinomadura sp. 7K507 TaxID=2530365 RepID=UPI001A9FCEFA|nr:DUF1731 domain-containing protein [Actinomadura sp. 7K507]